VAFSRVQTLEFWPNGTVHVPGSLTALAQPVTLSLQSASRVRSITVNSLGKITLE
jgi:hypothetical protein